MSLTPNLEDRTPQHYVAIAARLPRTELPDEIPRLLSEVYQWLKSQGIAATGAPLVRYLVINYQTSMLEIEVGVPVASGVSGDERLHAGVIPGGHYAVVIHSGTYGNLVDTTAELLAWAKEHGVKWQMHDESKGTTWRSRVETYLIGPASEPDPQNWRTEIAILTAEP